MVFWSRIRTSKLQCLSNQCKRWYIHIPGDSSSANSISRLTRTSDFTTSRSTDSFNQLRPRETVRFFGTQSKQKPEKKDPTGPRLNDQITGQFVRLVLDDGHEVVSRHEALERAKKLSLDLVEVQRAANPPVCKIMDFHREKYKQQLKEKDRVKSKSVTTLRKGDCKEVRFSAKTEPRDLQMKADMVKRLMEKGYRVKCTVVGQHQKPKKDPEEQEEQERKYKEFLVEQLSRLTDLIEEVSVIESAPKAEKKQAAFIVRHVKFGTTKKGPGKKAATVSESSSTEVQEKAINSSNPIQSPQEIQGAWKVSASDSDLEYDIDHDEEDAPFDTPEEINDGRTEKTWSAKDVNDDHEKIFDSNNISNANSPIEGATRVISKGKSAPMSQSPPTKSTGNASSYAKMPAEHSKFPSVQSKISRPTASMNMKDLGYQSPGQPLQQQRDATASIPTGPPRVVPGVSSFRNMNQPPITETLKQQPPQITPSPQRQPSRPVTPSPQRQPSQPVTPSRQRQPPQPVPPSPTPKSYGIFSSQIPSVTREENEAAEVSREVKEGNSSSTASRPSLSTENKQNAASDNARQEDWGIFSRKGSPGSRTPAQR
ncbi:hypothetical protein Scep_000260 [Stephania cephalantha]|uniref:Translation initiation factor 3 N-terminal domain-containing protein n=1 Tax=Stephania cephalantha TaxID=152367 RepID=A0AAP0Q3Z2_9MAGN